MNLSVLVYKTYWNCVDHMDVIMIWGRLWQKVGARCCTKWVWVEMGGFSLGVPVEASDIQRVSLKGFFH
jgi:hypothetical protein